MLFLGKATIHNLLKKPHTKKTYQYECFHTLFYLILFETIPDSNMHKFSGVSNIYVALQIGNIHFCCSQLKKKIVSERNYLESRLRGENTCY